MAEKIIKPVKTKSVKVYQKTHSKLKVHAAKKQVNITDFVSMAVENEMKKPAEPK